MTGPGQHTDAVNPGQADPAVSPWNLAGQAIRSRQPLACRHDIAIRITCCRTADINGVVHPHRARIAVLLLKRPAGRNSFRPVPRTVDGVEFDLDQLCWPRQTGNF